MTAKEMFEKLGYTLEKVIDDRYINYASKEVRLAEFYFDTKRKTFTKQIINSAITEPITLEELQAINKQVEELGWK